MKDHHALQNWRAAVMATGVAERSVSSDFEDQFTAFYLPKKRISESPQKRLKAKHAADRQNALPTTLAAAPDFECPTSADESSQYLIDLARLKSTQKRTPTK